MHHRRPAAPHSHRPNHRQINRLMPFTTAPLFHALQLLETGDSARFHMPGHKGEPVFNTYADIFAFDFNDITIENYQSHPTIKAQVAI